jgi:hypothetical protein
LKDFIVKFPLDIVIALIARLVFRGSQGLDTDCVDVSLQELGKRIINHAMPLEAVHPHKLVRNDHQIEVPFAVLRASVTGMQMTLVLNDELGRRKAGADGRPNPLFPISAQGSTRLNGLTVTLA